MSEIRAKRLASAIRSIVVEALERRLSDPRIERFTSVTRVEVSRDLEHARVYVSVMGDEAAQRRTLAGLRSATRLVRTMVGRQVRLRRCPEIRFELDQSIKRGMETLRLIEEAMREIREREAHLASEARTGEPAAPEALPPDEDPRA